MKNKINESEEKHQDTYLVYSKDYGKTGWILLRRYGGKGIKRIKSSCCPSGLGVHGLHWYIYQSTLVIGALVGTVTYIG